MKDVRTLKEFEFFPSDLNFYNFFMDSFHLAFLVEELLNLRIHRPRKPKCMVEPFPWWNQR